MKNKGFLIIIPFLLFHCHNKNEKIIHYENGKIKEKCVISYDLRNGVCSFFYENGIVKEISYWKNDTINGIRTEYFKSGKIKSRSYWKMGKLHGEFLEYYENGNIKIKGNWNDGKRFGVNKEYYDNGVIKQYRNYFIKDDKESYLNELILFSENGDTLKDKSNYFHLDFCCDTLFLGDTLVAEINVVAPAFKNSHFYFFFDIPENDSVTVIFSENGKVLYDYETVVAGENFLSGYIDEYTITEETSDTILGKSRYLYFKETYWVKAD